MLVAGGEGEYDADVIVCIVVTQHRGCLLCRVGHVPAARAQEAGRAECGIEDVVRVFLAVAVAVGAVHGPG